MTLSGIKGKRVPTTPAPVLGNGLEDSFASCRSSGPQDSPVPSLMSSAVSESADAASSAVSTDGQASKASLSIESFASASESNVQDYENHGDKKKNEDLGNGKKGNLPSEVLTLPSSSSASHSETESAAAPMECLRNSSCRCPDCLATMSGLGGDGSMSSTVPTNEVAGAQGSENEVVDKRSLVERMTSKKWSDRRDAYDALRTMIEKAKGCESGSGDDIKNSVGAAKQAMEEIRGHSVAAPARGACFCHYNM